MAKKKVANDIPQSPVKKTKQPVGRPTKYSLEMAERICDAVAVSSTSLKKICKQFEDFPNEDTVYRWMRHNKEFSEMYQEAKQHQLNVYAEETIEISDDSSRDIAFGEHGLRIDAEVIARSRLRVETRKWHLARLWPQKWGDKLQTESTLKHSYADQLREIHDNK